MKQELLSLEEAYHAAHNSAVVFDRSELPWARSDAELDEIWRKRVKNDGLSLVLNGTELLDLLGHLSDGLDEFIGFGRRYPGYVKSFCFIAVVFQQLDDHV